MFHKINNYNNEWLVDYKGVLSILFTCNTDICKQNKYAQFMRNTTVSMNIHTRKIITNEAIDLILPLDATWKNVCTVCCKSSLADTPLLLALAVRCTRSDGGNSYSYSTLFVGYRLWPVF